MMKKCQRLLRIHFWKVSKKKILDLDPIYHGRELDLDGATEIAGYLKENGVTVLDTENDKFWIQQCFFDNLNEADPGPFNPSCVERYIKKAEKLGKLYELVFEAKIPADAEKRNKVMELVKKCFIRYSYTNDKSYKAIEELIKTYNACTDGASLDTEITGFFIENFSSYFRGEGMHISRALTNTYQEAFGKSLPLEDIIPTVITRIKEDNFSSAKWYLDKYSDIFGNGMPLKTLKRELKHELPTEAYEKIIFSEDSSGRKIDELHEYSGGPVHGK